MSDIKLGILCALCLNFAWSPFQLRQGIDGEVLHEYPIAEPRAVVQQIRRDYAKPGKICKVLCGVEQLEEMHLTNFPDPDAVVVLTLVKCPVEAVVSDDGWTKIVGTDIQIVLENYLEPGGYLFKTLDRPSKFIRKLIMRHFRFSLLDDFTDARLIFSAELREFLFAIKNKLSEVPYEEHQAYAEAFQYLLYEFSANQNKTDPCLWTPRRLIKYAQLAERIRPDPEPEPPAPDPQSAPLSPTT